VVLSLLPTLVTATMIAIEMLAVIKPYSIAVAPTGLVDPRRGNAHVGFRSDGSDVAHALRGSDANQKVIHFGAEVNGVPRKLVCRI
jgi:hypothetical protein